MSRLCRPGIRVAVVQNASEVVHYSYGDSTRTFRHLGCAAEAFSDYNVENLLKRLGDEDLEVLVLAANALNSRQIRTEFFSEDGVSAVSTFLSRGGGLLVQHQLGLARRYPPHILPFLGDNLNSARAVGRPREEDPRAGNLKIASAARPHIAIVSPNLLEAQAVQQISSRHSGVPSLYWHYWEGADPAWWDTLMLDDGVGAGNRSLVLATKEADPCRVILCSLPFDWQDGRDPLANFVSYLADGRPSTLVLSDSMGRDPVSRIVCSGLQASGVPYRSMRLSDGESQIVGDLRSRIYDTVILSQSIDLPTAVKNAIYGEAVVNEVDVLTVPSSREDGISIIGSRSPIRNVVDEFVSHCAALCSTDLIDGSFWVTVDTLRAIDRIDSRLLDESRFPGVVLEETKRTELEDGSYDSVFVATVGLAWLKRRFSDPTLDKSLEWLRTNISLVPLREKLYYWTLLPSLTQSPVDALQRISDELDLVNVSALGQADCVSLAWAARAVGNDACAVRALSRLGNTLGADRQTKWIDLGLAGDTLAAGAEEMFDSTMPDDTTSALLAAYESILHEMGGRPFTNETPFMMGGSIRVTAKALAGLDHFARVCPVSLTVLLDISQTFAAFTSRRLERTANADLIDALRVRTNELNSRLNIARRDLIETRSKSELFRRTASPVIALLALALYGLASFAIAAASGVDGASVIIRRAFIDSYQIHAAAVGLVAAVGGSYFGYRQLSYARAQRLEGRQASGSSDDGS